MKGRPETSPLIVHVASVEMAREIVAEWPPLAEELARQWWPGPLTLVLPKKSIVPDNVTAGLPTVGVRMPNHPDRAGADRRSRRADGGTERESLHRALSYNRGPRASSVRRCGAGARRRSVRGGNRIDGCRDRRRQAQTAAARDDFAGRDRAGGGTSRRAPIHRLACTKSTTAPGRG